MSNTNQNESKTSSSKLTQIALKTSAIKVIDELINLEGSDRIGGSSISRADVLNDILIKKGSKRIRDFYYSKD